jgi:hypothetical protein
MVDAEADSSFDEAECVFGYLCYWLEDVDPPDSVDADWYNPKQGFLDEELLAASESYRRSMARSNLFMYLIDHDDSHRNQVLMRPDPVQPVFYVVDNTMSFEAGTNPTLNERQDWSRIHVPLYRELVERVRAIDASVLRSLRVLNQYERRGNRLVPVPIESEKWQRMEGALEWRDDQLRVGLTFGEVEQLKTRISVLLRVLNGQPAAQRPSEVDASRRRLSNRDSQPRSDVTRRRLLTTTKTTFPRRML